MTNLRVAFVSLGRNPRPYVVEPAVEKLHERGLCRLDISATIHLRDQPRTFALGLPFGSGKRMPLALAPAGFRIAHFDDDGPMAR